MILIIFADIIMRLVKITLILLFAMASFDGFAQAQDGSQRLLVGADYDFPGVGKGAVKVEYYEFRLFLII